MPIVAAVDQAERADSVIRQARKLADVYEVELHVVHVGDADVTVTTREHGPEVDMGPAKEKATQIAREIAQNVEGRVSSRLSGWLVTPLRNSSTTVDSTTPRLSS